MDIFQDKETKRLFEAERYTPRETRPLFREGRAIASRLYGNMSYILRDGKIQIINRR